MINEPLALLVIGDLECERLVPDEAAGASDTTHGALLFTVWFNPKFVGLHVFHAMNYICAIKANDKITCVKIVCMRYKVRYKITWALQQKLVFLTKYCDGAATKDVIDDMRGYCDGAQVNIYRATANG